MVNQEVAALMLERLGFGVDIASSGREAIQSLSDVQHSGTPYNLVLMDCEMPDTDGFEATREIRRQKWVNQAGLPIPVVALTASILENDREACFAAGMDDFLNKPFEQEQLRKVVERWLPIGCKLEEGRRQSEERTPGDAVNTSV